MSTYEKIILGIVIVLVIAIVGWSFHELEEPFGPERFRVGWSDFDDSFGPEFRIGPFTYITNASSSEILEPDCEPLKVVIASVLHDITERLEEKTGSGGFFSYGRGDTFEVNEDILDLFCHTTAEVTLSARNGDKLLLRKIPFSRTIPHGGTDVDVGSEVRIEATLIPRNAASIPAEPTVYGDTLIPDRFLDIPSHTPAEPPVED